MQSAIYGFFAKFIKKTLEYLPHSLLGKIFFCIYSFIEQTISGSVIGRFFKIVHLIKFDPDNNWPVDLIQRKSWKSGSAAYSCSSQRWRWRLRKYWARKRIGSWPHIWRYYLRLEQRLTLPPRRRKHCWPSSFTVQSINQTYFRIKN